MSNILDMRAAAKKKELIKLLDKALEAAKELNRCIDDAFSTISEHEKESKAA